MPFTNCFFVERSSNSSSTALFGTGSCWVFGIGKSVGNRRKKWEAFNHHQKITPEKYGNIFRRSAHTRFFTGVDSVPIKKRCLQLCFCRLRGFLLTKIKVFVNFAYPQIIQNQTISMSKPMVLGCFGDPPFDEKTQTDLQRFLSTVGCKGLRRVMGFPFQQGCFPHVGTARSFRKPKRWSNHMRKRKFSNFVWYGAYLQIDAVT